MNKDMKELVKALEKQGYVVEQTKNGHLRVRNAGGVVIATMASTPSDRRSRLNAIAALRRSGFTWKR